MSSLFIKLCGRLVFVFSSFKTLACAVFLDFISSSVFLSRASASIFRKISLLTLSSASDFTGITVAIALSKLTPYLCFIHMARLKRFSSALSSLSGIESMDFNFESSTFVLSLISIT